MTPIAYSHQETRELMEVATRLEKARCLTHVVKVRDEEKDSGSDTCPPCQYHTDDRIVKLIEGK